jgi:SWI/SNF-related matrix-associated actin-dependent regulator 1 of chromatin subfamily A
MIVTYDGVWYWAHTEFSDRERVKAAGFLWDPQLKRWKTKFPARAALLRAYCDEGALLSLEGHFAKLEASRATDSAIEIPAPEGRAYKPFQKAGIAFASNRAATLIADEPGLGKTIQAIGVVNLDETCRRVLVVCPASLKLNWQRELERWLVRLMTVEVHSTKSWPGGLDPSADLSANHVVIVNYEAMVKLEPELSKVKWDLVVLDEAHYCKTPEAKRSQAAYRLAMGARRRLVLTGTPILSKPIELQPLAGMCDPDRFGDPREKRSQQRWSFLKRYCGAHQEMRGRRLVWVFDGATHLDELQERLRSSCMVRRLKSDVLGELSPKVRQIVPIEAPEVHDAEAWAEAESEAAAREEWYAHGEAPRRRRRGFSAAELLEQVEAAEAELEAARAEGDEGAYRAAVKKLRYLNQVAFTEMSEYRHRLGMAKVEATVEYVRELLDGGVAKVVVFAHHRDVLEALQAELDAYGPVLLYGGMAAEDKDAAVVRFQGRDGRPHDPTCRVFLGQIQAAGTGLTLTVAQDVVFAELDWVPANTTQAEDRCHRITQRGSVRVHHLVVDGTLDAHMSKSLVRKQEIADQALDLLPPDELADPGIRPGSRARAPEARTTVRRVDAGKRAAAIEALRFLAARCDGAREQDGAGFSGLDTAFGKRLAGLADLSDAQFYAAWRLLRKYRRTQLPVELVAVLGLEEGRPAGLPDPEREAG